jgi:hypothetical protein
MYDLLIANQQFIIGLIAAIIVWLIAKWTGKSVEKTQIMSILTIILDIIQDVKTNPATANLTDYEKKKVAINKVIIALPVKKQTLLKKVFGTIGGAVEFVFQNRKTLVAAAALLLKKVF